MFEGDWQSVSPGKRAEEQLWAIVLLFNTFYGNYSSFSESILNTAQTAGTYSHVTAERLLRPKTGRHSHINSSYSFPVYSLKGAVPTPKPTFAKFSQMKFVLPEPFFLKKIHLHGPQPVEYSSIMYMCI